MSGEQHDAADRRARRDADEREWRRRNLEAARDFHQRMREAWEAAEYPIKKRDAEL